MRIEFEFKSSSFVTHNHNPDEVDMIICWKHDWQECPEHIEVIELSSMIGAIEGIKEEIKEPKVLSEYNRFCQEKRLEGLNFTEIGELWQERKAGKNAATGRPLTAWQRFCQEKRREGMDFQQIATLWRERKSQET